MRQVEEECARIDLPPDKLMENAGKAVAEAVKGILGGVDQKNIIILIGPGNNGGDGLVAARYLHGWGTKVNLLLFSERTPEDQNFYLVQECGINCVQVTIDEQLNELDELLSADATVIDALFGIGKIRPFFGTLKRALDKIADARQQQPGLRIIALDLPSGLNADTGAVDPSCLYCDHTITLGFPKSGLFSFPGMERVGKLTVADIGIPSYLVEQGTIELITAEWAKGVLPERPITANKGSFGKALVAAGSIKYIGAAALACNGAVRTGAGLVTLATPASLQHILAAKLTEVTYLPLSESHAGIVSSGAAKLIHQNLDDYDVLLLGCGLGQSRPAIEFVEATLLRSRSELPPLVIDADALNTLARIPNWWQRLTDDAILTPHPGEMARLAGISVEPVQLDRLSTAKRMALEWCKTIVLKGACTVIAAADGRIRISPFTNPGLASAGTGDVLSGIITGLVAQGLCFFDAAAAGVFLHGQAGEMVKLELGDMGMTASDLLPVIPLVIKQLKEQPLNIGE
jgi:NAD(P)H-hydrate epimerase